MILRAIRPKGCDQGASVIEDHREREYRAGSEKMGPVAEYGPADPGGHA